LRSLIFRARDQSLDAAMCAAHGLHRKNPANRFGRAGFSVSVPRTSTREASRGSCLEVGSSGGVRRIRVRRRGSARSILTIKRPTTTPKQKLPV
jgi:hypothetical protein